MRILKIRDTPVIIMMICCILSAASCNRGSDGFEDVMVTNKTSLRLWCDLKIDGYEIPVGASDPGGTATATLRQTPGKKLALFNLVDMNHKEVKSEIVVDLTKIGSQDQVLCLEILSLTEVKAYYKHEIGY